MRRPHVILSFIFGVMLGFGAMQIIGNLYDPRLVLIPLWAAVIIFVAGVILTAWDFNLIFPGDA